LCVINFNPNESTAVLVIDDSSEDVQLLQLAARECLEGIRFYAASDGDEAKAYLKGEEQFSNRRLYPFPALILLDLNLRGLSPYGFLEWLRGTTEFRALQVVVWTGSDDHRAIARALAAGANRVVRKPSDREGLAKLIGEMAWDVAEERPPSLATARQVRAVRA
jgi:CheY-like chemotaxis protein